MKKTWTLVVLCLALVGAQSALGDDKKEPAPRSRGVLPAMWSKLGLTDEQKQRLYATQSEYTAKIEDLRRQMRKLQREERMELEKVLTDAQKARLKELITEKAPSTGSRDEKNP
jgi:hypothetical protein